MTKQDIKPQPKGCLASLTNCVIVVGLFVIPVVILVALIMGLIWK